MQNLVDDRPVLVVVRPKSMWSLGVFHVIFRKMFFIHFGSKEEKLHAFLSTSLIVSFVIFAKKKVSSIHSHCVHNATHTYYLRGKTSLVLTLHKKKIYIFFSKYQIFYINLTQLSNN